MINPKGAIQCDNNPPKETIYPQKSTINPKSQPAVFVHMLIDGVALQSFVDLSCIYQLIPSTSISHTLPLALSYGVSRHTTC